MQCDFCPNEATIEIGINMNGEIKTLHLCASCYEEKMKEFLSLMPAEWGNQELSQQIQEMLGKSMVSKLDKEKSEKRESSPQERAFDMQRSALHRQRKDYMRKLEAALMEENYEECALFRDEINRIGDAIVQLNEERKDLHGV